MRDRDKFPPAVEKRNLLIKNTRLTKSLAKVDKVEWMMIVTIVTEAHIADTDKTPTSLFELVLITVAVPGDLSPDINYFWCVTYKRVPDLHRAGQ